MSFYFSVFVPSGPSIGPSFNELKIHPCFVQILLFSHQNDRKIDEFGAFQNKRNIFVKH